MLENIEHRSDWNTADESSYAREDYEIEKDRERDEWERDEWEREYEAFCDDEDGLWDEDNAEDSLN